VPLISSRLMAEAMGTSNSPTFISEPNRPASPGSVPDLVYVGVRCPISQFNYGGSHLMCRIVASSRDGAMRIPPNGF
jgi:hypothetical protein